MYPLLLQPTVKNYLWGGQRLAAEFHIATDGNTAAEAWMLSCNDAGETVIRNGPDSGRTLADVLFGAAESALGTSFSLSRYFPFLIKLIDAGRDLSVQVHPGDLYAQIHEGGFGKNEAWYILDAEEGATILYGFTRRITREELRERVADQTLEEVLRKVPVKRGDVIYVPAGTVHAVGAGILLAEVQQNSDSTYRLFDYGRTDKNGKPRELHVEKALDVAILEPSFDPEPVHFREETGYSSAVLASCSAFTSEIVRIDTFADFSCGPHSFFSVIVTRGDGRILFANRDYGSDGEMELPKGTSLFLPAGTGDFRMIGECEILLTSQGPAAT